MSRLPPALRAIIFTVAYCAALIALRVCIAEQPSAPASSPFVHPGMLHLSDDLERIKRNVADGTEPWAGAWKAFLQNRLLAKDYKPHPLEIVGRGVGSVGQIDISPDASAAYYNAIAWYVSGDEAYGKKSIEILNAWSHTCKEINGKDAVLCAGIYGYKFANAAEIMRRCGNLWPEKDAKQFEIWLRSVVYPVVKDFATFANGNWNACCLPTMMSIGIYCDDRPMFDRAVRYYLDGAGNGSLTHYIIDESGQCQESGRDQGHTQLGLGLLAVACETGYHQGLDMYGSVGNRLLKGLEYTAKYNLGQDVPFAAYLDWTGKYAASRISSQSRGRFTPIWELVSNHYQNRLGMDVPLLAQAAARRRPEFYSADQPGNGTLLFSLPPFQSSNSDVKKVPAIPEPVIAKGTSKQMDLTWIASLGAKSYTVKRATNSAGPFIVIAEKIQQSSFTDSKIDAGKLYYYVVSAANAAGASANSLPASASAGLPSPWTEQDVGPVSVAGTTDFDGSAFTLEAAGQNIGGTNDELHFAYAPLTGDGTFTARFVPQVPSQFAKLGLMIRAGLDANAARAAVLLTPELTRDVEQPGWYARLTLRESAGAKAADSAPPAKLDQPIAVWGRLMSPFWLRLVRAGDHINALTSVDGQTWNSIGSATVHWDGPLSVGLCACSGLKKNSTRVSFDHVSLKEDAETSSNHATSIERGK